MTNIKNLEIEIEQTESRFNKSPDGSKERRDLFNYLISLKGNYYAITGKRYVNFEENRSSLRKPILYLLPLLAIVFLMSFVSANISGYQNTQVYIRTNEVGNNATIGTITFPNGSTQILNSAMTKNGSIFYYLFSNTNQVGNYIYDYQVSNGNTTNSFVNTLVISAKGDSLLNFDFTNNINVIIIIFSLLTSIILFFVGYRSISGVIIAITSLLYMINVSGGFSIVGLIGILGGLALMIGGNKQ